MRELDASAQEWWREKFDFRLSVLADGGWELQVRIDINTFDQDTKLCSVQRA